MHASMAHSGRAGARYAVGLFVGGLAVGLAACGTGAAGGRHAAGPASPSSPAPTSPSTRPAATGQRRSARASVLAAYASTASAGTAEATLHMSIAVAGRTITESGAGVESFANDHAQMTLQVAGQTLTARVLAPRVYIEIPAADRSQVPGHKTWAEIDLTGLPGGQSLSQLSSAFSPTSYLATLRAVAASGVQRVGRAEVGGVATTEYRALLDPARLATVVPSAAPDVKALGGADVPVELWIDQQGRLRQSHLAVDTNRGGMPIAMQVTMQLSHFGVPVHVSAPPAADVAQVPAGALAGGPSSPAG